MKISAIDIRKHTFEKIFRGYDPEAVDAFLNSLSHEWERFTSENAQLKMRLEETEKELHKLKDIEVSLFRTLKTAEDTSKLIEQEANEVAKQKIEEANVTAAQLISEAQGRTGNILKESEDRLKRFKEEFTAELKTQERDMKAIENYRDNLIVQLSSLANSTIETVSRFQERFDTDSVYERIDEMKTVVNKVEIPEEKPVFAFVPEVAEEIIPEIIEPTEVSKPIAEELPVTDSIDEDENFSFFLEPAAPAHEPLAEVSDTQREELTNMEFTERATESTERINSVSDEEPVRVNKFRSQEPSKHQDGGGSFFDQI